MESILKVLCYSNFYLVYISSRNGSKKINKKRKEEKKKKYNWMTLFGFDESQVTPVWPHKSFETFQFKVPLDVKPL